MKRLFLIPLVIVILTGLVLGGCTKEAPAPAPTTKAPAPTTTAPAPTPTYTWPKNIELAGQQASGSLYPATVAWSTEMEADTGMKVRVAPVDQNPLMARMVKSGQFLMMPGSLSMAATMIEASPEYTSRDGGPWNLRLVWSMGVTSLPFWSKGDSNIKTMADIKPGIKWGAVSGEPPYMSTYEGFFGWAGLDVKDTTPVPFGTWGEAIGAITTGRVDIVYGGLSNPAIIEANATPGGLQVIEMNPNEEPEGAAKFWAAKPTMGFAPIPSGGIKSAIGKWAPAVVTGYHSRAEADTELIYNITKWLGEKNALYRDKTDYGPTMSLEAIVDVLPSCFLPWHEGTIKYLKEKGKWTAADDARQKKYVDLVDKYVAAYQAAIDEADKQGIKVDPTNKPWVDLWASFKKGFPHFGL